MVKLAKLTDKEQETLNTMLKWVRRGEREKTRIYMLTANDLHIAPGTLRARISRIRSKYEDLLQTMREIRSYQQAFFQRTGGRFNPLSRSGK